MKIFIVLGVLLALGMAAIVINHSSDGGSATSAPSNAAVEVVTHGDAVDIDALIPRSGITIVEFYADW